MKYACIVLAAIYLLTAYGCSPEEHAAESTAHQEKAAVHKQPQKPAPAVDAVVVETPVVEGVEIVVVEPENAPAIALDNDVAPVVEPSLETVADRQADEQWDRLAEERSKRVLQLITAEAQKRAAAMDGIETVQGGPACPPDGSACPPSGESAAKTVTVEKNQVLKTVDGRAVVETTTTTTTREKTDQRINIRKNVQVDTTPATRAEMARALLEVESSTAELLEATNRLSKENRMLKEVIRRLEENK